jgi:hypothetical protein
LTQSAKLRAASVTEIVRFFIESDYQISKEQKATFILAKIVEAHRYMESNAPVGKIVVIV